jgi:hypothetical protein
MMPRTPTAAVAVHPAIFSVRDGAGCLDNRNAVTAAAAAPPLSLGANEKIKPTTRITPTAGKLAGRWRLWFYGSPVTPPSMISRSVAAFQTMPRSDSRLMRPE